MESFLMRCYRRSLAVVLVMLGFQSVAISEDEPVGEAPAEGATAPESLWNLKTKTLGGRQFWGDVLFFRGWRIQHNVLTGHYRLLDPHDVRHAWGEQAACRAELEQIKTDQQLAPMQGKAVIVVHGIVRSSKSFGKLRQGLEEDGYTVVGFDYPSTRVTIQESAEYLHRVIESLEGIDEISFVAHSMGGLLVRTYLIEHCDHRIRRMVMLGVPNHGANLANLLQTNPLFKLLYGPAGRQLVQGPESFVAALPTPEFEFAVIAGARGTPDGWNPLIAGDDDGTVELANTRLPGAADFMTVNQLHSFLMSDPDAIAATRRFLKTGALGSGSPQPVENPATNPRFPGNARDDSAAAGVPGPYLD